MTTFALVGADTGLWAVPRAGRTSIAFAAESAHARMPHEVLAEETIPISPNDAPCRPGSRSAAGHDGLLHQLTGRTLAVRAGLVGGAAGDVGGQHPVRLGQEHRHGHPCHPRRPSRRRDLERQPRRP
ncbi:hypothetical protein ACWDSD_24020 [Streptomyces spiralis]